MSNEFTKVGPPDKGDRPRKRGRFLDPILGALFTSIANPLFVRARWLLFWRTRGVDVGAEPKPVDAAWHGLPEAELTDEDEQRAISDKAWYREHPEKNRQRKGGQGL